VLLLLLEPLLLLLLTRFLLPLVLDNLEVLEVLENFVISNHNIFLLLNIDYSLMTFILK
jgi:hypothetical protein